MSIRAPYLADKKIKAPYLRFVNARLHEMAQSELMSMIDPAILQHIKATDQNPKFRAYVIGHEGESHGRISPDNINYFRVAKRWFKSAIQNLHSKIKLGLTLFHSHFEGENQARNVIGEVVGKKLAEIGDRLSVIIAAYIKPEYANLPLDVASIEAEILLTDNNGEYAADVEDVSAIALGNSSVEKPGFEGATLLTQLFEFAEKYKGKVYEMELSIDDVKKVIKAESLKPSDLFTNADLSGDPSVKGLIESTEKQTAATFHDRFRRQEEKLKEAEGEGDKKKEELEKENKTLRTQVAKSKVDGLFAKAKEERKLTEKQEKFIEKKIKTFEPSEPEKLEDEFSSFLDDQIKDFKSIAADVFGEKEERESGDKKGGDGDGDDSDGNGDGDVHPIDSDPMIG